MIATGRNGSTGCIGETEMRMRMRMRMRMHERM
jgi:hypothetical protein